MMRMWQGASGLAEMDALVSPAYVVLAPKKCTDPLFAAYLFKLPEMIHRFWAYSYGLTDDRLRLYFNDFKRIPWDIPPLPEQKKIAEILSTWDKAIETTEKLLANADAQKRALMQRLLNQTSWPLIRIGELGTIRSAGVDKKEVEGERPVRILNYLDVLRRDHIFADELNHWVTAPDRQIENCDIRKGDVFFTPSSETRDDIGHSAVAMEDIPDAAYSYHIVRFRPSVEMDLAYSAYAFKSNHFYRQCYSYCEGSGQRYVISQDYFRSFSISFPPIARQREIGQMLSTFDEAISNHRRNLSFLRDEKRALMQQLLTGKRQVTV
jgi:type I restriction enzyme S subunit